MTDAIWWYERDGQQAGPVAHAAMLELVREGRVLPSARVWRSGMAAWTPLSEVPELAAAAPATAHPAIPGPAVPPPGTAAGAAAPAPPGAAAGDASSPSRPSAPPASDALSPAPDAAAGRASEPSPPQPTPAAEPDVADTRPPPDHAGAPGERRSAGGGGAARAPALPPPPAASEPPGPAPAALPDGMEPVSSGVVVVLGILTLGIYVVVRFFQAATAYEALAGRRSRFHLYFWLTIGLALAGGPLHLLGALGWAAHVASIVFAALTLVEVLADRKEAVRVQRIAPVLHSDTSHEALFIAGLLTVWLGVGLVLLLVQAVRFFDDHRAIAEELQARASFPPGWPPPGPEAARPTSPPPAAEAARPTSAPPGEAPPPTSRQHAGARTCPACGSRLGPAARFCEQCGAAAPAA